MSGGHLKKVSPSSLSPTFTSDQEAIQTAVATHGPGEKDMLREGLDMQLHSSLKAKYGLISDVMVGLALKQSMTMFIRTVFRKENHGGLYTTALSAIERHSKRATLGNTYVYSYFPTGSVSGIETVRPVPSYESMSLKNECEAWSERADREDAWAFAHAWYGVSSDSGAKRVKDIKIVRQCDRTFTRIAFNGGFVMLAERALNKWLNNKGGCEGAASAQPVAGSICSAWASPPISDGATLGQSSTENQTKVIRRCSAT